MIPRLVAAAFAPPVRSRGEAYYKAGNVRLVRVDPTHLQAIVRGTVDYVVDIAAERGVFTTMCSCPFASDAGLCKHIWATLLFADAVGDLSALSKTAGKNPHVIALSGEVDADVSDLAETGEYMLDSANAARYPTPKWGPPAPRERQSPVQPRTPRKPEWKTLLDDARGQMQRTASVSESQTEWPADRRIVYVIDLPATSSAGGLLVELLTERRREDGTWDPPAAFRLSRAVWRAYPDPRDRDIAQMLIGASTSAPWEVTQYRQTGPFLLSGAAVFTTLPLLCATGRCRVRHEADERPLTPAAFDAGDAWALRLRAVRSPVGQLEVEAVLRRGISEMPITQPSLLHEDGFLLERDTFARFDAGGAFALVPLFRKKGRLTVPGNDLAAFLESFYTLPNRPDIELPSDLRVVESQTPPRPAIVIHPDPSPWRRTHHRIELGFLYGRNRVTSEDRLKSVFDRDALTVYQRDLAMEQAAREHLASLGVKEEVHHGGIGRCLTVSGKKLGALVANTVSAGWHVEADGAAYRAPGAFRAAVRSSIDWFELTARVQFGDTDVPLADLLAASRSGETTIPLPGGDIGMIPADLLARVAPVAAGATIERDGILRFARSQTALIDALLAAAPQPDIDATFERARSELRAFNRVQPADPPPTFRGTLREYQREGLGWLHFLRRFELGGCLADDMGLGKTVQVLALLESRRQANETPHRPSIVVVPRSLIFNWLSEARRFAPQLRMLDFAHPARRFEDIAETDVALTTYGTLRRDSARLSTVDFDYAILDEAQAIKTAGSASAKAARLLQARHRLAITGTPIENRIEELWSLFDFLNPGMLGARTTFAALARLQSNDTAASDRSILSRALRPVILRRTKTQVAPELPARIEQTLLVELEGTQRRRYDHLLATYRESVLERVDRVGLGKARMHILEALLRLRQAACHLALVDKRDSATASAKLDALIPALEEVVAEGHKAIVFSQFTQFLALARTRLESAGLVHEYLDGKTLDRQARVDRFQNDESCSIFLISLKAGGHGLNLTAADYVYILDPWWNPAVEAQAIDRAHRIGQTRRVIATRIVASGTIEEKILELQASKRALADAILGQDQGALSNIGREELEMLLSPLRGSPAFD